MNKIDKQTIYFVDDQKGIRDAASAVLLGAGYHVTCFEKGADCLEALAAETCSLLITDVRMPGMDGMELLERVGQIAPRVPVVIITAYGDIEMAVRAMKSGAADFIEKPLERESLLTKTRQILLDRRQETSSPDASVGELKKKAQQLEHQIRVKDRVHDKLFQNAKMPMFRTDINSGKVLACNEGLANLFGYGSMEECLEKGISLDHYTDPSQREKTLQILLEKGKVDKIEAEFKRVDGSPLWIEGFVEIFPDKGYIEGAMVDITAQKILTHTEKKVLSLLLDGKSNSEVAYSLQRATRTIEDHRGNIMKKLGASSPAELAKIAIERGFTA